MQDAPFCEQNRPHQEAPVFPDLDQPLGGILDGILLSMRLLQMCDGSDASADDALRFLWPLTPPEKRALMCVYDALRLSEVRRPLIPALLPSHRPRRIAQSRPRAP